MSSTDELILLYTALAKPSYRRGLFDALCYPNGHVVRYSYRKHHIHPSLLECSCRLEGKKGMIVYVDMDEKRRITYFPIRFVIIHRWRNPARSITEISGRERIYLPLGLDDLVEYEASKDKGQWHETVSKFDAVREVTGLKPKYFVIEGTNAFRGPSHSGRLAWEDLVSALSQSSGLRDGIFVRLGYIKDEASQFDVGRDLEGERLVYKLSPANIYRLDFSVFEQPGTKLETEISVRTSATELLTIDQPFQSVVSGLVEKSALIACKRTTENTLATVSLAVREGTESYQKSVNSPMPVLFVRISFPRKIMVLFLASVLLGTFLVSADSAAIKQLPLTESRYLVWTLLLKAIGAVILALAAWLGFRRLPKGSS